MKSECCRWRSWNIIADGYRKAMPKWKRNTRLEQCYKWLTEFGYQMSTEEIEMMSGTHSVFKMGKE